MKIFLPVFLFCFFNATVFAQSPVYPKDYFASPMDIALELAGNFGELRPNHFHTGIDITTHGVEGQNVKSAAEGYVSRIKIGPWGYGRVMYITHPNGFTTVYGHLSRFNSTLETYTEKQQYLSESFEVEFFPQPGEFPVKKGELIAFSGNTGSSGGPHLHFEIRDTKTEEALNPLLFGLPVNDNVDPVLVSLVVYPMSPADFVNGSNEPKRFLLKKNGTKYALANATDSIVAYGKIGFAIEAYDKESVPAGKNGVYAIRLQKNKKTIYTHHLDRMPFDKSRFINCFIDYEEHEKLNRFLMRSFLLPNNQLPIYDTVIDKGYSNFQSDSIFKFTYTVSDIFGNKGIADFKVKSLKKAPSIINIEISNRFIQVLLWDTTNLFEEQDFRFETPSGAFYENGIFRSNIVKAKGGLAPLVFLGDPYMPIQKECSLTIYAAIPEKLQSKALMVTYNDKGSVSPVGGTWTGKGITAGIKEFGEYSIRIDTTAPKITPSNFDLKGKSQTSFAALKSIRFTISDNLAGIASYRATIDGKWVLMQYDPRKKTILHTFDERTGKGEHELVVELTDKCGNKTVYRKRFTR